MKFLTIITFLLIFTNNQLYAERLPDIQSTRVTQSGGAGVGSLLINEATLLNPASIVFLPRSTVNYQKSTENLVEKDSARTSKHKEGISEIISIQDTSTELKGGFSYVYQNTELGKRKRFSLSSASPISKELAMGVVYRFTQEESGITNNDYHQFVVGFTQILNEDITFGLVMVDPFGARKEYRHNLIGLQYNANKFFQFMVDVGSGDMQNPDKSSITKYAIQLHSFEYFFLRYGRFHDKFLNQRGLSYGISWVGPKFSIDYAIKNSEIISEDSDIYYQDEKLVETSFAISALF